MSIKLFFLSALLSALRVTATGEATEVAAEDPVLGTDTVHGCYSSLGSLTLNTTDEFNSQGSCATACRGMGAYVGASNAELCYCGSKYPPLNTLVDDSECTEPCPGYGSEACGGIDTYTVYNTGLKVSVANSDNTTSSSSTSSTSAAAAAATSTTATATDDVVATITDGATSIPTSSSSSKSSGGTNTVGVAVGAVVGVVGAACLAGGVFFCMRRRRNQEIEDEHRRNAAVNSFIAGGGKPPGSSGGLSILDQRLDPVMAQRRMSSGSIADNQDYSRRILRVTNA